MVSTMDNKVAIVTGAASGIGLAIAQELAMRGVLVTLSDIDEKKGNEAAAELPAARFQYANMTSENDCQRLVTDTIRAKGHVDILVNNAGIQHVAPITDCANHRIPSVKVARDHRDNAHCTLSFDKGGAARYVRPQMGACDQYRIRTCIASFGIQVSIRGSQAWTVGTNPRDGVRGSRARRHV